MAEEDLKAELERLKAENESLKARRNASTSMKVSEKGALSVYGLGRFPVTLYQEQWTKLLAMSDQIKAFIAENKDKLRSRKVEDRCLRAGKSAVFPEPYSGPDRQANFSPSAVRSRPCWWIAGRKRLGRCFLHQVEIRSRRVRAH